MAKNREKNTVKDPEMINHRHHHAAAVFSASTHSAAASSKSPQAYSKYKRKAPWRDRELIFKSVGLCFFLAVVVGGLLTIFSRRPISGTPVAASPLSRGRIPLKSDESYEPLHVLLGVTTSQQGLIDRVPAILKTWGSPSNLPEDVTLVFFVGEGAIIPNNRLKALEDAVIYPLPDIQDSEYPPVRKTVAVMHALHKLAVDNDKEFSFRWIMRVDDDAYVNVSALRKTLNSYHPHAEHYYFGRQGKGTMEDRKIYEEYNFKSYYMGGLGDIFSPITLKDLDKTLDSCVTKVKTKMPAEFWHSDVLVGYCVEEATGLECNQGMEPDDKKISKDILFSHNFQYKTSSESWVKEKNIPQTIILHPFKKEEDMVKEHERIQKVLKMETSGTTNAAGRR